MNIFKMRRAAPLSTGPEPSARILKMFILGKRMVGDTYAWSTCLHKPGLLVYPGLVYLFTQAWSTCLPRPGLHVYSGLVKTGGHFVIRVGFEWFQMDLSRFERV